MTIKTETRIRDFDFWGEALKLTRKLTCKEWDTIENGLEEAYPDGMTDCELNDMFHFYFDERIVPLCGLTITEEELLERADE